jgi:YidC/Oxa1 family membrane protein insertase
VNPLGGCLPLVLQIPVFIGLNHVLRSFRAGTSEVYYFKQHDVLSYLDAKLFGVHLGDVLFGIPSLGGTGGFHWSVAPLAIPLMIIAAIATHFTARLSVQRQLAMGTPRTSQTDIMNKVTLYLFPFGVLIFGGGFPVGLLLYWLSNNVWTLAQQHFVFRRIDREEEVQKETALQNRANLAPRPGQKPAAQRKRGAASTPVEDAVPDVVDAVEDARPVQDAKPVQDAQRRQDTKAKGTRNATRDPRQAVKPTVPNPAANKTANKPAPGQRPSSRNAAAKNANRTNGATKQDGPSPTANGQNGQNGAASEIPGLISDRSRRKKQNRKRG